VVILRSTRIFILTMHKDNQTWFLKLVQVSKKCETSN
jgi:hypothetical protein